VSGGKKMKKKKKQPRARVNPEGFMGSASREHKVKKGKGSYTRQKKHKKKFDR
tara:strand:- start:115 stop:273 length:159 start_codon:yes stop_codon:yes gene_type:complete